MQFSLGIHKHATFILVYVSVFTFKTQAYSKNVMKSAIIITITKSILHTVMLPSAVRRVKTSLLSHSCYLDLIKLHVVRVKTRTKKKTKNPNYFLAWCWIAKLLFFSCAYFKGPSRYRALWVFPLKLKECFTN